MMHLEATLSTPACQRLASLLALPRKSTAWRQTHLDVPYWALLGETEKAAFAPVFSVESFVDALRILLRAIASTGEASQYWEKDSDWLAGQMTAVPQQARCELAAAFCSLCVTQADYLTPAEIAEVTGTHESGWRARPRASFLALFSRANNGLFPRGVWRGDCGVLTSRKGNWPGRRGQYEVPV